MILKLFRIQIFLIPLLLIFNIDCAFRLYKRPSLTIDDMPDADFQKEELYNTFSEGLQSPDSSLAMDFDPIISEENKAQIEKIKEEEKYRKELEKRLLIAFEEGNLKFLTEYVEKGGDINFKGKDGDTLIMFAIYHFKDEMLTYLLDQGADPNIHNYIKKKSAFAIAIRKGNLSAMKILIEKAKVNPQTEGPSLCNYLSDYYLEKCSRKNKDRQKHLKIYNAMFQYIYSKS